MSKTINSEQERKITLFYSYVTAVRFVQEYNQWYSYMVTEWIVLTDLVLLKMLRWCHYFLKTLEFPYTFIPLEQKKSQLQNSKKINSNVEVMLSYST